jgi:hypothetical protein
MSLAQQERCLDRIETTWPANMQGDADILPTIGLDARPFLNNFVLVNTKAPSPTEVGKAGNTRKLNSHFPLGSHADEAREGSDMRSDWDPHGPINANANNTPDQNSRL